MLADGGVFVQCDAFAHHAEQSCLRGGVALQSETARADQYH